MNWPLSFVTFFRSHLYCLLEGPVVLTNDDFKRMLRELIVKWLGWELAHQSLKLRFSILKGFTAYTRLEISLCLKWRGSSTFRFCLQVRRLEQKTGWSGVVRSEAKGSEAVYLLVSLCSTFMYVPQDVVVIKRKRSEIQAVEMNILWRNLGLTL